MRLACGVGVLVVACGPPREAAPLADMDAWTIATPDVDPFAAEDPADTCDPARVVPEDFGPERALSINTGPFDDGLCKRVTVVQPLPVDVRRGDRLHVRAWHDQLTGPDGAQAVLAIAVDGVEAWRDAVDVPTPIGGAILGTVELAHGARAGSQLAFHLHNHGANSYHLLEITDLPPGTGPAD